MVSRDFERTVMSKVYARLLPFGIICYFLAYLDRVNASFAALTMRQDLGLSAEAYGFATGLAFYIGYCIFEIPSNLILEKVGARIWIARIMITWGFASAATAYSTGAVSFAIFRFLLGVFEAGFFPGLVLYYTYWFPDRQRARIVSGFMLALPISVAVGAPISTAIMEALNGVAGYAGWKWVYIIEGIPTILIGIGVLFFATDRPEKARWLTNDERNWLSSEMAAERRLVEARGKMGTLESLWNPKVVLLAINYLGIVTASLGLVFFLPQMVKQLGLTNMQTGWVTMIPYTFGAISMFLWGWFSDRIGERRWNLFAACALSAFGLAFAAHFNGTWLSIVGMSIATAGLYGSKGPFWALPSLFLTGGAAAAGIAWINSVGNIGGAFGPTLIGFLKDATGSFEGGLYALAGFALLSTAVSGLWLNIPQHARAGEREAVAAE